MDALVGLVRRLEKDGLLPKAEEQIDREIKKELHAMFKPETRVFEDHREESRETCTRLLTYSQLLAAEPSFPKPKTRIVYQTKQTGLAQHRNKGTRPRNSLVLGVGISGVHGYGIFSLSTINPGTPLVEYVGEVIRETVADKRESEYHRINPQDNYFFRIDSTYVIDATKKGNISRFLNHSCEPNCIAKTMVAQNKKHVWIYSSSLILPGEELTYDYKFPSVPTNKMKCLCGKKSCRKTID
ncbi:MAG: SET domain-containing protein [Amphiamblys sp. WSBS2006]|nr:MAG: SET domain-containing protein [Amphiamblys sp. WSBS2006]